VLLWKKVLMQNLTSVPKERMYIIFQDSTASSHQTYQTCPEWVSQVMPSTNCAEVIEFDLSAIAPGTIKDVLK